jgi:hypothetical protein
MNREPLLSLVPLVLAAATLGYAQTATPTPPARDARALLRSGDTVAISAWIDEDPGAVTRADAGGVQPIHWASLYGHRGVVELLVARGADLRASGRLGTALHAAAFGGQVELVRWLAAQGLDPNAPAEDAPPLLAVAIRRGNLPLVEALLDVGASPRLADPDGNSPLLLAASASLEPAVKLLLAKGADVSQANARGTTPLDVARREGHSAIIALLEARGAKGRGTPPAPAGPYLGQKRPGSVPELFGPEFISTERRELNAAFSPDGRELFFARDRLPRGTAILVSKRDGDRWTRPTVAAFSAGGASDVDVFLSADGQEAYFCSDRPDPEASAGGGQPAAGATAQSDIWVVSRVGGGWGEPKSLGKTVNSDADDYYPTLARDGTLYFSSNRQGSLGQNDIYRSRREKGQWTTPENLGAPVNTPGREYDPFIAPDQSYLLFASERPGGFGTADLYVSFRTPDGSWGEPRNLGPSVNTDQNEYTPMLSPDGQYLFFTRGRLGADDIFWVEAAVIRELGPATRSSRP